MNITKSFILLFFSLISVFICSQEKPGGLDSFYIQATGVTGGNVIVKNNVIYNCLGEPCEGFQTDYYDNDESKVRMTGRFKKGMPIDTVKEYYENGIMKSLYYPYKRKYKYCGHKYNYCLYIEYDEKGNCIRYTNDKDGVERKYRSDGALISVLYYCRRKSSAKYYVENFPGSKKKSIITKGNKYDYDENERLRRHWVRKSTKYDKKSGVMSATFYFEEYDVEGDISRIGRFYSNLYEHDQWLHISPEFPADLDSVPMQDFKEIVYPRLNIKDVYKWDYVNNRTIITRYELNGEIWIETERRSLPRV